MDIGWKLVSTGATLGATVVTSKVVGLGWKAVTGHEAPVNTDDPDLELWEVVAFAAVSGALLGLTRHLALRQAAKWYGGDRD
ncbi:DUF4235 domain-containing protein [Bogoriella caseilytica]|uniref:Uncharacterized protein DUF4235 n=1 Tax=Bogoriella caseilytica TaxID=56055 RepID=A0A3N2BBP6_9MICO|nr:DUF4235 domain-containing protein [Bogoriella caseilytica]ROR72677.1 uncharacterized protein DUF4235 [Bogoriella caseilytica]